MCFLLFSLSGFLLVLGVSCRIGENGGFLSKFLAFVGEHSLLILLANLLLRRIYFLLLFRLEYGGEIPSEDILQQTLRWWDSLGCTVFMVAVPVGYLMIKGKVKDGIVARKNNKNTSDK